MKNNNPYSNIKFSVRKIILATQKNKLGECMVYVEVLNVDEKKYKRIPTNQRVKPQFWSKAKEEVLKSDSEYHSKNQIIDEIFSKVKSYLIDFDKKIYRPSIETEYKVLLEFFPQLTKSKSLTDFLEDYKDYRKKSGSPHSTYKEFTSAKNRLEKFEKFTGKTLYFNDMTLTFSDNFFVWMKNESKYSQGTIEKTFTILKTFLEYYFKRQKELNIFVPDIYKDKEFKKGKKSVNEANPLTYKEFIELFNYDFKNDRRMAETKDRFCLQCSTGLRYSDIDKIRPDMIIDNRIMIEPQKTQETKNDNVLYIDLNQYSKKILQKYSFDTSKLKITNQKYNENLKLMFNALDMPVKTSHNARDTFISILIEKNVPVPIILSWTGQSSYSILKRYIKLTDTHKKAEMNRVFK